MTQFSVPDPGSVKSLSIVPPTPVASVASISDPLTPSESLHSLYTKQGAVLYVHAIIRYENIFQKHHWTTVCAYHVYGEPLDQFTFCPNGNDMDRD